MRFFKSVIETVAAVKKDSVIWDPIARWAIYLLALLTPVWFLPTTAAPVETNKMFYLVLLAVVVFIAWLGRSIQTGSIRIARSWLLGSLGIWVVALALSAIFSISPQASFWGQNVTSVINIAAFALIAFVTASILQTRKDIGMAHTLLLISGVIVILFEIIHLIFNVRLFPWGFAEARTFNPLGSWNSLGIFFGFLLVTVAPLLEEAKVRGAQLFLGLVALFSLIFAALVNFATVWLVIGGIALIFLAYDFSHSGARKFGSALALLLVSVLLFLSQTQIAELTKSLQPPIDVMPNNGTTFSIAKEIWKANPMFGSGPNTFEYAWDKYRDRSFNDTIFWGLRFNEGSSFGATLIATTGLVGTLAVVGFFALFFMLGIKVVGKAQEPSEKAFSLASFAGTAFLLVSWFIYPVSAALVGLTFISLGIFIAHAVRVQVLDASVFPILSNSALGFVSALAIILCMVGGIVALYISGQKYVGAVFFGKGSDYLANDGSVNSAEQAFNQAVTFDSGSGLYYQALAQTSLLKLQRIVQNSGNVSPDDLRNNFQLTLSNAIANARKATELNAADYANWQLLGQIYESVAPLVDGATNFAVDAYKKAADRGVKNPVLFDNIGRMYITMGDYVQAREALNHAIELKADYAAAHFRLAQIAAAKGNIQEATNSTENAALAAPNDIGVLFQLGLLYYQQDRLDESQQVFERAISLNKNYSNARYFLGLIYGRKGDYAKGAEQFSEILKLNPGNKEVQMILANLQANKSPLTGISPPAPNPTKRENPPINDQNTTSKQPAPTNTTPQETTQP
jgi:tetratricopeptide (TPR) repeat protein